MADRDRVNPNLAKTFEAENKSFTLQKKHKDQDEISKCAATAFELGSRSENRRCN